jgi:hypothetical protein
MSPAKLRAGELLALAGAICVLIALFIPYYEGPTTGSLTAWDTFGAAVALMLAAVAAALAMFTATLTEHSTALPVTATVWAAPLGLAGSVAAIVRLFERPEHATAVCTGGWLALIGTLAILGGAWRAIHDERRSSYEPATPMPRARPGG